MDGHLIFNMYVPVQKQVVLLILNLLDPSGQVRILPGSGYHGWIDFTLDQAGQTAVAATWHEKILKVWDLANLDAEPRLLTGESEIEVMALTPNGTLAILGTTDGTLIVWDLTHPSPKPRSLIGHTERIRSVRVTPDSHLAISSAEDDTIKVWDLSSDQCLASYYIHTPVCAAMTNTGSRIVVGDASGIVHILHLEGWNNSEPDRAIV
jgi:WD40 repeat protein